MNKININTSYDTNTTSFKAKRIPQKVSGTLKQTLLNAKKVDIYPHTNPKTDPDAANTAVTLANFLLSHGISANIKLGRNKLSDNIIRNPFKRKPIPHKNADVSILLDVNSLSRIEQNPKGKVLVFDHHIDVGKIKNAYKYIDTTAKSCCAMMFNLLKSWNIKLSKTDAKNLLYGTCDDYIKSKYIKIENGELTELPLMEENKNAKKVLYELRKHLSPNEQKAIFKKLDILSQLTPEEKIFQKRIFEQVKTTNNGKLAYIQIDPNDKQWAQIGMDNKRTSAILRDFRQKLIGNLEQNDMLSVEQKEKLKNVQATIVFYRTENTANSSYQMSIHSKNDFALNLITYVRTHLNKNIEAGGHPNRSGGRIQTINPQEVQTFVNQFLTAAEKLS